MRQLPLRPDTPLLSMAIGVWRRPACRIASEMPGTCRSMTERVASGVTSRGPRPVPPVVTIRSTSPLSAHSESLAAIAGLSSGTIS